VCTLLAFWQGAKYSGKEVVVEIEQFEEFARAGGSGNATGIFTATAGSTSLQEQSKNGTDPCCCDERCELVEKSSAGKQSGILRGRC
jgi:hypothetical protein